MSEEHIFDASRPNPVLKILKPGGEEDQIIVKMVGRKEMKMISDFDKSNKKTKDSEKLIDSTIDVLLMLSRDIKGEELDPEYFDEFDYDNLTGLAAKITQIAVNGRTKLQKKTADPISSQSSRSSKRGSRSKK